MLAEWVTVLSARSFSSAEINPGGYRVSWHAEMSANVSRLREIAACIALAMIGARIEISASPVATVTFLVSPTSTGAQISGLGARIAYHKAHHSAQTRQEVSLAYPKTGPVVRPGTGNPGLFHTTCIDHSKGRRRRSPRLRSCPHLSAVRRW